MMRGISQVYRRVLTLEVTPNALKTLKLTTNDGQGQKIQTRFVYYSTIISLMLSIPR